MSRAIIVCWDCRVGHQLLGDGTAVGRKEPPLQLCNEPRPPSTICTPRAIPWLVPCLGKPRFGGWMTHSMRNPTLDMDISRWHLPSFCNHKLPKNMNPFHVGPCGQSPGHSLPTPMAKLAMWSLGRGAHPAADLPCMSVGPAAALQPLEKALVMGLSTLR